MPSATAGTPRLRASVTIAATSARSLRLARQPRREAAVDLERVERHSAQQAERRPACAEIVQRDGDAELADGAEDVREAVHVVDALALGELDEQVARVESRAGQRMLDTRRQVALERVAR